MWMSSLLGGSSTRGELRASPRSWKLLPCSHDTATPLVDFAATMCACDSLTAIIAIGWTPHYGRNHMDAIVDTIVARIPKERRHVSRGLRLSRRKSNSTSICAGRNEARTAAAQTSGVADISHTQELRP